MPSFHEPHYVEPVGSTESERVFNTGLPKPTPSRTSLLRGVAVGSTVRTPCATPELHDQRNWKVWCRTRQGWKAASYGTSMEVETICLEGWTYVKRIE